MAKDNNEDNKEKRIQKSYFDVLGICCQSEVPLIEKILKHVDGVKDVNVIVTSRTVIVYHDTLLISQLQIVKILNQARLEANLRGDYGEDKNNYKKKWPNVYTILCGILLLLYFLKYVYLPLQYLALAAVAVGIFPVLLKAFASIRNFRLDINILVLIAVAGSIALKDYWEAGTIVFLFTIAEWLESRASHKADAVMSSLVNLVPHRAILAETGEEMNTNDVKLNTLLSVKDGEIIPLDGIVIHGNCEVDEKTLTGESFPVPKQKDSLVWAGTINLTGYITVKTTSLKDDCVVTRMGTLVEEAQKNKSKTQTFIDKCTKYYTPAVMLIAICIAVIPAAMKVHNLNKMLHLALVVLVSGCPCALILSTPVATSCALSKAATSGLRVKGANYLETLAQVKIMAFDKTGTITRGEFLVTDFRNLSDNFDIKCLLFWVSSIECKSSHPMASALVDYAKSNLVVPIPEKVEEFQNFPGEGIYGRIDGRDIYVGNLRISARTGYKSVPTLDSDSNEGKSIGYIFCGSTLIGSFRLSDVCRTGVKEAIKELKSMGIKTAMLTGDSQDAANHAQDQLEGSIDEVHAELLPEDKARIIKEYQKISTTAMIGDGLNDAAALATADIGISMGISGSALAIETAQIILLSNDIRKIPSTIRLARRMKRKVIENVLLSVSTKAGIIALALAGHPIVWAAVLADVGTCLLVIFNSMLLLGSPSFGRRKSKKHNHAHVHKHAKKGDDWFSGTTSKAECTTTKCCKLPNKDEKPQEKNTSCCRSTSLDANGKTEKCPTLCENNKTKNHDDHHHDHDDHQHAHGHHDHHHNHHDHGHHEHDTHDHDHHDHDDHDHGHHDHDHHDHDHHHQHDDHDQHDHGHHDHDHHHHHDDHHDHDHDDIITEEELGRMVKECCKDYNRNMGGCCKSFRKECCRRNSHFGVGFGAGGLCEIVIE